MKIKLFYILFICAATSVFAQQTQISGTVVSSEDNFPIAGANILIQGKNAGTTTDFDGNYYLTVDKGDTIIISYIGFASQTFSITDQSNVNAILSPDNELLDEIVVVGYGTQRKKEVTGAVAVVDAESIQKLNPVRVEQALQGQVSGVSITAASGSPGSSSNIRIRGISTNGNNNPLILVDGNVIEDLSVINPNDIKSINVLKDATAGIYGVRAANGVILIETKTGRKDSEMKFSLDTYYGFQETSNIIDVLDPSNYAVIINESLTNNNKEPEFDEIPTSGTDWQDEVFSVAPIANVNFNANGGTTKSAYSFGASYINQDGIVGLDKSNYNRITANLNYQYDITDKFKLSATSIYTHSNKNRLSEGAAGSVLFNAINMNPTLAVYDPTVEGGFTLANDLGGEIINPVAQLANTYDTEGINKISATFGLDYLLFNDKVKVSSKIQMNHAIVETDVFRPEVYYGSGKSSNITINEVVDNKDIYNDYTWDNFITYTNTFNSFHNVNILFGTSAFKTTGEYTGQTGNLLVSNGEFVNTIEYASIDNATIVNNRYSDVDLEKGVNKFDVRLSSIFTRMQYNYKGKYLVSAVIRRDGSTRFGPNNRFGYFPSGSIGWNISEESFLQNNPNINNLKLRMSYGIIGNDRIADYAYVSTLSGEAIYVSNEELVASDLLQGVAEGILANPDVKWEQQKTFNIGLDTKLFDNRISITLDAFRKITKDLLIAAQISGLTGVYAPGASAPVINAGTVQNEGLEFQIAYNSNFSDDFKINASYNFTTLQNEVLDVAGENGFQFGGGFGVGLGVSDATRMEAGQPLGYFYGYKTDGLFQTQEEIDNYPTTDIPTVPGDLKIVDVNGDGEITTDDRTYIGDPIADVTMGFNLGLTYKNIDFSAAAFASIGNDLVRDYERAIVMSNKGTYNLDRWTPTNTNTNIPRLNSGATVKSSYFSDFYVEDASYLRINNVQVGYSFDESLISKIGLNKIRVYVSVNNLYTFTNYRGYDPAASTGAPLGGGIDKGFYPAARTYLLGLNLKF